MNPFEFKIISKCFQDASQLPGDDADFYLEENDKDQGTFGTRGRGVLKSLRSLCYYPSEVLCSPFWKLWHWCWRKRKGYL